MQAGRHAGDQSVDEWPSTPERGGRKAFLVWAAGALSFGAVIAVVAHLGEARQFAELAKKARPGWFPLAAALQLATYVSLAAIWRVVLGRSGSVRRLVSLVPLALAKLFTDQALPSGGVSGTILVVRGLERRGVDLGIATAAVLVQLLGFYASFALSLAVSLTVLAVAGRLNVIIVTLAAIFSVVALAVPAAILFVTRRGRRMPRWANRFAGVRTLAHAIERAPHDMVHSGLMFAAGTVLQLAVLVLDALTLQAMLAAIGQHLAVLKVFTAFVVALVAETVGITPGGLGTFEAASIAVLRLWGIALEPAVAATLLLRGFTFWLPMIPGVVLARRELRGEAQQRRSRANAAG